MAVLLTAALGVSLVGCAKPVEDLKQENEKTPAAIETPENSAPPAGETPAKPEPLQKLLRTASAPAATDFSVRLLQNTLAAEGNTLVSPLSVLSALAMTANGARGETLAQMETVLGMDRETLNQWIRNYMAALPSEERYKLSMANSIWYTDSDRFAVNPEFVRATVDSYDAGIYPTTFNDAACKAINGWVEEHTDGRIRDILDSVSADAVMYLVNALAFEAEWQSIYKENQVRGGTFTTEDGREQKVELMWSDENAYLEDEKAEGFLKYYTDRKYAFAALLPKEGVSVEEYVASLTGDHLHALLSAPREEPLKAAIPRFEATYKSELSGNLMAMGMRDAFNPMAADLSGLGTMEGERLHISLVIHQTFLAVDERGTEAGAATVVGVKGPPAIPPQTNKEIVLDRPFVYMLIDCENSLPFFIGTAMDMAGTEK